MVLFAVAVRSGGIRIIDPDAHPILIVEHSAEHCQDASAQNQGNH